MNSDPYTSKLGFLTCFLSLCLCILTGSWGYAAPQSYRANFNFTDKSKAPIAGVMVYVPELELWGVSNADGQCTLTSSHNLKGKKWKASIMGYKGIDGTFTSTDLEKGVSLTLLEENLTLDEVTVVAQSGAGGESTSSIIGRQALDHLQATSLKDVLQLIPGNVNMSNPSLIGSQIFSVRDLSGDSNAAFGATVLLNGLALSRNANLPSGTSSLAEDNSGTDLRRIATDDVESIEVIRGVASAEYGDMSSGIMIVNNKVGVSDLKIRSKIMPGIFQASIGKGFKFKKDNNFNFSVDYANGHSDPRYSTDTYHRGSISLAHRKIAKEGKWVMTTHGDFTYTYDWSGPDPSEPALLQKYNECSQEFSAILSHDGKINFNLPGLGTLKYIVGLTCSTIDSRRKSFVGVGGGSVFDALETGMYKGVPYPISYDTYTGTDSRPLTVSLKLTDNFNADAGEVFKNRFNLGLEWKSEGNLGEGKWDKSPEYIAFADGRRQKYCDIPFLNQGSFFVEDKMEIHFSKVKGYPYLNAQLGLRGTMIQMGSDRAMGALSPRLNVSLEIWPWVTVRAAFGLSHKMPSVLYLYPDAYYVDHYNQNVSDGSSKAYLYTTNVFDVYNRQLRPMKTRKYEAGLDLRTPWGQSISVIAYHEQSDNAFSSSGNEWVSIYYDKWYKMEADLSNPDGNETIIVGLGKPANSSIKRTCGVELDCTLGKIKATNTSFYLSGAWTRTTLTSSDRYYCRPVGCPDIYSDVYVAYPEGTNVSKDIKRLTASLRIVQHIPTIRFIISASAQCVFTDYSHYNVPLTTPIGYISADGGATSNAQVSGVTYTAFTQADLTDPNAVFGSRSYRVKDQIFNIASTRIPTEWPAIWSLNLRATKEFSKYGGLSFFVNNFFFHQPWQKSTTSANQVERNSNFLSYGLELSLKF